MDENERRKAGRAGDQNGDDRTSALGLLNYAHSYWLSAVALQKSPQNVTHRDAPIYYLYFHAIELYLKAFLRSKGTTLDQLREIGHKPTKLLRAANGHGLEMSPEDIAIMELIEKNYIQSRYIETGAHTTASLPALWGLCLILHEKIAPPINSTYGIKRKHEIPSWT